MAKSKVILSKPATKVVIVDDHPAIREALAIRIATQPDLTVCGEAGDIPEALRLVDDTDPDVAVIDISLESGSGLDLIKRIRLRNDRVRIVVWSMYGEDLYAERALRAGAQGYLTKGQATNQIIDAIRLVLAGQTYLGPVMAEKLLKRVVSGADVRRSAVHSLSDRELDVFRLIGQGRKTQEIADDLHLSVKTVETYRDRIRQKLNLGDGTELARCAVQWVLENG